MPGIETRERHGPEQKGPLRPLSGYAQCPAHTVEEPEHKQEACCPGNGRCCFQPAPSGLCTNTSLLQVLLGLFTVDVGTEHVFNCHLTGLFFLPFPPQTVTRPDFGKHPPQPMRSTCNPSSPKLVEKLLSREKAGHTGAPSRGLPEWSQLL